MLFRSGVFKSQWHLFGVRDGYYFPLGTDKFGRDLLSRMLVGSQVSLTVGLIGILISFTIGIVLGGVSGYFGGWVDNLIQRLVEVLLSFPRLPILLAGALVLSVAGMFVAAGEFSEIRVIGLAESDIGNLSGREFLWPVFEAAAAESPWFGWGVGAGNAIVPPDSPIVKRLHTWAAHNEYLRILTEGGQVGLALLILAFAVWVWARTRHLPAHDRRIAILAFVALAALAVTDNVLISTPACVFFVFAAALFSSRGGQAASFSARTSLRSRKVTSGDISSVRRIMKADVAK